MYDPSLDRSLNPLDLACMPFGIAIIVGCLVLPWHVGRLADMRLRWGGAGMLYAFGGIALGIVLLTVGFIPPWASQPILAGALLTGCETYTLIRAWRDRPRRPRRRRIAALTRRLARPRLAPVSVER